MVLEPATRQIKQTDRQTDRHAADSQTGEHAAGQADTPQTETETQTTRVKPM